MTKKKKMMMTDTLVCGTTAVLTSCSNNEAAPAPTPTEDTGAPEIRDIGGDAQVNLARGTVVTNAKATPNEMVEFAGPQSYHQDDYSIFYNNIKDNVAKRIAAYKAN